MDDDPLLAALVKVGTSTQQAEAEGVHGEPRYATPNPESSARGKQTVIVDGHVLSRKVSRDSYTIWQCKANRHCKVTVKTNNEDLRIIWKKDTHNHIQKELYHCVSRVSNESVVKTFQTRLDTLGLRVDNFAYRKHSEKDGSIVWYCVNKGCKARAVTYMNASNCEHPFAQHNHDPKSDDHFASLERRQGVKRRISLDPSERPQKAVDMVIQNVDDDELDGPSLENLACVAKRKKSSKKPRRPRDDCELSSTWTKILSKEIEVHGGSLVQQVENNVVMLGSEKGFQLLRDNCKQIFGDGTFKFSPAGYVQMYTIHIYKNNKYIQVAYFLLKNKFYRTYNTMCKMIKKICPELNNAVFQLDFEAGVHKAVRTQFPGAVVRGCRFHLTQAWNRRMQRLGLQKTYIDAKSQAAIWLKTIFGLPCLQPEDVEHFFTHTLCQLAPTTEVLTTYITYLTENYIKADSTFPPAMWAGVLDPNFQHTTNGCESYHRHFGSGILSPHPSIFDWLGALAPHHKRSMIKSNEVAPTRTARRVRHAAVNGFLMDLKRQHDAKKIDTLTFVKTASLNMLPPSKNKQSKRTKAILSSIKRKYASRVNQTVLKH